MGSKLREDRFALPTPETIDYIPMKFLPQGGMISCEGPTLMEALRCTAFSAATEPRLCPKTAVKLTINNDKLT
ncbi:hypothetical protein, partial [Streptomyces turgidiscabies]|uniref:hypothetical protein n=1 Tax=Streptomyces turgidiscabies TaxID=85558 RepID=UPI0038F77C3B